MWIENSHLHVVDTCRESPLKALSNGVIRLI